MLHMLRLTALLIPALLLAACESPALAPRYQGTALLAKAAQTAGAQGVSLTQFQGPANFPSNCRGLTPLALPEGRSPTSFIQEAFSQELGSVLVDAKAAPGIVLQGTVEPLNFSTSKAITMGEWNIGLVLRSSNGRQLSASVSREFDSGFEYHEACRNTAAAFTTTVQSLIESIANNPEFPALLH